MTEQMPTPSVSERVILAMDHGQFVLRGGLGDLDNEFSLLEQALATQPNAGDGLTMVVLSPHQNNFEMPIDVDVFAARPPDDNADWQQICEDILRIGPEGVLQIDSSTMSPVDVQVLPGEYLVQVSGRGFVNYGWPGTTTPDDEWRIRLFPTDGTSPRPAVRWDMPGYGIPDDVEQTLAESESFGDDEPQWVTALHVDGPRDMIERTELDPRAAQHRLDQWGGQPIEQVATYNGGQTLTKFDRSFVQTILHATPDIARQVAVYAVTRACEFSGLADELWIRDALVALGDNSAMPAPFDDISHVGDAFARLSTQEGASVNSAVFVRCVGEDLADNPFGTNNEPRYMTIPALYSAQDQDTYKAAIETVFHASCAYGSHAGELHAEIRRELADMDRTSRGQP